MQQASTGLGINRLYQKDINNQSSLLNEKPLDHQTKVNFEKMYTEINMSRRDSLHLAKEGDLNDLEMINYNT